jgi:hypothetical protein
MEKAVFLKDKLVSLFKELPSDTKPVWGKMTVQQMIEHFSDATRVASGKIVVQTILTPDGNLQKMRDFLMSEKPFRENTPNPLLPEVPPPVKNKTIGGALAELQEELDYFFSRFQNSNSQTSRNPFFGDLNYEQNIHLLYKHAQHHLRQFGIDIAAPSETTSS